MDRPHLGLALIMLMGFVIRHDGKDWIAKNDDLTFSGPTLDALDKDVRQAVREMGVLKKGEKAEVFMAFDNSTIPEWIRQYAQHYFDRVIEVQG